MGVGSLFVKREFEPVALVVGSLFVKKREFEPVALVVGNLSPVEEALVGAAV